MSVMRQNAEGQGRHVLHKGFVEVSWQVSSDSAGIGCLMLGTSGFIFIWHLEERTLPCPRGWMALANHGREGR